MQCSKIYIFGKDTAREAYNIGVWNREIFEWPFKKYVAAKKGYTTTPFIASKEIKEKAREVFF